MLLAEPDTDGQLTSRGCLLCLVFCYFSFNFFLRKTSWKLLQMREGTWRDLPQIDWICSSAFQIVK